MAIRRLASCAMVPLIIRDERLEHILLLLNRLPHVVFNCPARLLSLTVCVWSFSNMMIPPSTAMPCMAIC